MAPSAMLGAVASRTVRLDRQEGTTMAARITTAPTGQVARTSPDSALEAYVGFVMTIPLAEESDGSELIAEIMAAEDWEDLNGERSKLPKAELVKGKRLKCTAIERHESTEEGGIGWYLVIDAVDIATGEAIKWQTSAQSVMAKLVKLSMMQLYPVLVEVTQAEKATKRGRKPMDLTVHSVTRGGTPGY